MNSKRKCPVPVTTTEQSNQNKRFKGNISLILLQLSRSSKNVQLELPFEYNYDSLEKPLANMAKQPSIHTSETECSDRVTQSPIHSDDSTSEVFLIDLPVNIIGCGESRGSEFTRIQYSNSAYLYQVERKSKIYYEVFKRKVNKRFGNITYPNSKAFGKWAWTTPSLDRALEIYNKIDGREF